MRGRQEEGCEGRYKNKTGKKVGAGMIGKMEGRGKERKIGGSG